MKPNLLSSYYVPDIVLSPGDIAVSKKYKGKRGGR